MSKAKRGKGNFRAKKGIEKNLEYQKLVKDTIKNCLFEYLEDNIAREYLSGKMDTISKLEKTKLNLKKEAQTNITAFSIETLEKQITTLREELPENASILKKIKTKKFADILEYVLFQLQRVTISFMKNNKIEYDNTRNEIVAELDSALNKEADGADNHELISKLQSSLNAIDIDIEQEYLTHKVSWDILEKEKPKKQFIKLESLRACYHDPTLLDPNLPAPQEKLEFFTFPATKMK